MRERALEKEIAEYKEYFGKAQKEQYWVRVHTSGGGSLLGKVSKVGDALLYLNPAIIFEESPIDPKFTPRYRLEEQVDTAISLLAVSGGNRTSEELVNSLLSRTHSGAEKHQPGFKG